jgi:transposase
VSVAIQSGKDQVVIAVDPHKASWTAAVDASLQPLARIRVPVSRDRYRALRRFARRWPKAGWRSKGPPAWGTADQTAARRRNRGHRRPSEAGRPGAGAVHRARTQNRRRRRALGRYRCAHITHAEHRPNRRRTTALRAIVDHRDDLVKTRTQTVNPLHVVLTHLIPAGAKRNLTADHAAELLRGVRPHNAAGKTLRALAMDLVSEVRQLDRRIAKAAGDIHTAVTASGTTLTDLHGVGTLTAAEILAHVGDVGRFRSAAAFASYTGTAPIEVSSGDVVRHRLSRAGDRQLNCCLHVMAITQVRQDTPGRAYYLRKRSQGKSHNEALRCLKRRLSDIVYRQLIRDADEQKAGPGGHSGAALSSCAAG